MNEKEKRFLGIDVSKGYADFILLDKEKKIVEKNYQLDDNKAGHQLLKEQLLHQVKQGFKVICGLESTGGYELNWARAIKELSVKETNVEIYKLNARGVKHQLQSELRRTITDGVSAEGIAIYLINNYAVKKEDWQKSLQKATALSSRQMFCKLIVSQQKHQTAKYNQLEKLVYQNFPELLQFCKNGIPKWVVRLLEKYPGLAAIKNSKLIGVDAIKGIIEQKAALVKELAKNSVGVAVKDEMTEAMLQTLASEIIHISKQVEELKERLIKSGVNEEVQLLTSIKGVAEWTAIGILVHLTDVSLFKDADQLAAFFGVHPILKQSGDGKWGAKMSKQGNKTMRSVLYNAAANVVQHNPYFKNIYANQRAKGKTHRSAIGIIMHKLLRVIFGMLKNKTAFNAGVDLENQKKNSNSATNENAINITTRRYQELNTAAPISGRNYRKRKVVLEGCQALTNANTASPKNNLTLQT